MQRRTFCLTSLASTLIGTLKVRAHEIQIDSAVADLQSAISSRQLDAAAIYVRHGQQELQQSFGKAKSPDAMFLIASISKPISVAGLMTLHDQGLFQLDQPVSKFLPEFKGDGRQAISVKQLLTHASGLPDQLPENEALRKRHAPLSDFVELALQTPLLFPPGTRYSYSSMGILLAAEIAQRISGASFPELLQQTIFQPLDMQHSSLGLGRFQLDQTMLCQVEHAAPESGAGDPESKSWDWNSSYWRNLGAPWGGAHASASDIGRFFFEFLQPSGKTLQAASVRRMITNQNREGLTPRGLGFAVGAKTASPGCSEQTFGHGGSTGTLAWADPATDSICVVLTTLPGHAVTPHPRQLASDSVARAAK